MDNNNQQQIKTAPKLNIKRIIEKAERLKRAEIKEKEWLRQQQTQQSF